MNTIKIYLKPSGSIAELYKDFALFKNAYQNKLVDVYVPKSVLYTNQNATFNNAVKIGGILTADNGAEVTTDSYYLDYLKDETINGVDYVVYERTLPKELTVYAGNQVIVLNVISIDNTNPDKPVTLQLITTQTANLLVQNSAYIDDKTAVDETFVEPTKTESVISRITTNEENIHDLKQRTTSLEAQVDTNTEDIAGNRNEIDILKQTIGTGEDYVGTMTVSALPTDLELNNFVQSVKGREAKGGDTVIVVYQIAGETDKNYKYIYNGTDWISYEIPPVELANNGTHGIIEGTYGVENYNTLVDISGGQIINIYIKGNDGNYKNLRDYVNMTAQDIEDIINGDTVVGEAMKAVEDGLGNNIANTYLTQVLGATKQFVRDYAQPREFGSVYFISSEGFVNQIPTTPEDGVQFSVTTSGVGSFTIFTLEKTNTASFDLTSINGYNDNLYISADKDATVQFRLTTEYQKAGESWNALNVELSNVISMKEDDIQRVQLNSPFTALGDSVLTLNAGDKIRQKLEVVTQSSDATIFKVYSNEIYPSTFSITSQSYILEDIDKAKSQLIMIGMDGVIEENNVVFKVQNAENFVEYRTNQREFLVTAYLPVVGEIDQSMPIRIEFGDTVYNVYTFMKGTNRPITVGDFWSVGTYNQEIGYTFVSKMIFLETSDYVGFAISPATITANQLKNIIKDTDTIITSLDESGTKLQLQLSASQVTRIMKALQTPSSAPSGIELVAINESNSQVMLELGEGLYVADGQLKVTGAGEQGGTTNYNDLDNKPVLNSNNTTSQTPSANEVLNGTVNLHKISKTGALADAIEDATHRTVTDTEKADWNNTNFSRLTNVPSASEGVAGIIQVATDQEAETGTNTTKAVNPKQLLTAIQGLGNVFDLKGTKATVQDLPSTGNEIGDVWYVTAEQVGYIWLNDGTTDKWEQFGAPIDLSGFVQYVDIVNNLTSEATNKVLSAYQGKVLNDLITAIRADLTTAQGNITSLSNNKANASALDNYLPLIGGNLTGRITVNASAPSVFARQGSDAPILLDSTSSATYIQFASSGATKGYMGVNSVGKPVFYDSKDHQLAFKEDVPTFSLDGTTLTITL
jgi:hypothetical protein